MLGLPSAPAWGGVFLNCLGPAKAKMRVLFQNEHFLAADKPAEQYLRTKKEKMGHLIDFSPKNPKS